MHLNGSSRVGGEETGCTVGDKKDDPKLCEWVDKKEGSQEEEMVLWSYWILFWHVEF